MTEIIKTYEVTMRFQHPAWDERDGIKYEVEARSKSEANRWARRLAERDGHACGGNGRYWFSAKQIDDN